MANEPYLTVVGNLTGDPELRYIASGQPVCNLTIAQTPRIKQRDEWIDGETIFFRCALWREVAEHAADSLRKGMRVIACGRLRVESFQDKNGNDRQMFRLEVDEIGPSLRWARAQVTKVSGTGQRNGQYSQQASQGQYRQQAPQAGWENMADEPPF